MPEQACTICGDIEPFHVHDRSNGQDRRIDDYFTVGRGMSEMDAARAWQARALLAETLVDGLHEALAFMRCCELSGEQGADHPIVLKALGLHG